MEMNTIIGIVIAVVICLVGLRMILRKPKDIEPSLDSELHINEESHQPVIPRHVRDQLRTESAEQERIEPDLNTLDTLELKEEQIERVEVKSEEQEKDTVQVEDNNKQVDELLGDQVVAKVIDKPTVQSVQGLNTVESATKAEQNTLANASTTDVLNISNLLTTAEAMSENSDQSQTNTNENEHTEEVFVPSSTIETAKIQDFDDESSILDVHLNAQQRQDDQSTLANAESIIAINVYPDPRRALSGDKTLKVLLKYGLRFGEMSCFHRYEDPETESMLMFSVLRITENGPAGFDLEALSVEQVQGLAFFLALPHPHVQKGFDTMVSLASLIAREIDGTIYDENNLEFTPQLKEHWRHKAIDFRSGQAV